MKPFELLAQAHSPDGTVIQLKRRDDEYVILAANRHLMSSRTHASEESLATFGCRHIAAPSHPQPTILIGGLGMGYTLRAALDLLPPRAKIIVAELIPAVVDWNRGPLAHLANHPLADTRVRIEITDVAALLSRSAQPAKTSHSARSTQADRSTPAPPQKFDAILLDTDNSPAAFTDSANAYLYSAAGLAAAHASLNPGGTLALWSATAQADAQFTTRLRAANFTVHLEHTRAHANKGPRHTIYLAQKADS
jgi:predicted ribosomally synthesized peptide with SipW-like signal peptide